MGFKRKHSRIQSGRVGQLQKGSFVAQCKVVDVSETGVRLESRMAVKLQETVQLLIECGKAETVMCKIQVMHVHGTVIGAKIVSITPEDQARFTRMLDDDAENAFSRRW